MPGRAVPSSHPALPLRPLALAISLALSAGATAPTAFRPMPPPTMHRDADHRRDGQQRRERLHGAQSSSAISSTCRCATRRNRLRGHARADGRFQAR
jgi:hypothetical protein